MPTFQPPETPSTVLENKGGPMRLSRVVNECANDKLAARRRLDQLETDGKIKRFVVGNHVFVDLDDD